MQPVERGFQEFRRRQGRALEAAERAYRAEAPKFGEDATKVSLSQRSLAARVGSATSQSDLVQAVLFSTALQVWASYRPTKQIYSFDPALAEALDEATWPEELDVSTLFLPVNGCVVALPVSPQETECYALFYDYVLQTTSTAQLAIRVAQIDGPRSKVYPMGGISLQTGTLKHALDRQREADRSYVMRRVAEQPSDETSRYLAGAMASYDEELDRRGRALRRVLNAVLYINGNEDVVRMVHPGGKPRHDIRQQAPRRERRGRDLAKPEVFRVGTQFGAAIAHWESDASPKGEASAAAGSTLRPHLRRAHLHLYWTGPGREVPRFKVVRPTVVGTWTAAAAGETLRVVR
jgi:hypothetical protein